MRTQTAVLGATLAGVSALAFLYYRKRESGESGDAIHNIESTFLSFTDAPLFADQPPNILESIGAAARKVASVATLQKEGSTSGVRGIRNNNPGNIRLSSEKWQGLASVQNDPAFFQFVSPAYGVRAIGKILLNYEKKYSLRTVRELITRWAPPVENNTTSYVDAVARAINVQPDENLNASANLPGLTAAIIRHENGSNPYTTSQINEWVYLT